MSQRMRKKAQFQRDHPFCCFCGGTRGATTVDHVPPRACFPRGLCPEELEFPACNDCNNGTSKHDTIFGFYSMLVDFNEANRTPEDRKRMDQLRNEIGRRYPEALPDPASGEPIYRAGHIETPSPVAYSISSTPALIEAMNTTGEKLAHALYYREMKKIMTGEHRFFAVMYQLQRAGTEGLTEFFKGLLPELKIGRRSNIHTYGNRFAYMYGCKAEEGLFLFAAQFGYGLVCWGMVLGPDMKLSETNDALAKMKWRPGASGLGGRSSVITPEPEIRGRGCFSGLKLPGRDGPGSIFARSRGVKTTLAPPSMRWYMPVAEMGLLLAGSKSSCHKVAGRSESGCRAREEGTHRRQERAGKG